MIKLFLLLSFITSQEVSDTTMVFVEGNDTMKSFYMDKYELTMAEFNQFVEQTGYKTTSEVLDSGIVYSPYHKKVKGINWRHDLTRKIHLGHRKMGVKCYF